MNEVTMSDSQIPVQVSTPQSQPASQPPSTTTPDVAMDASSGIQQHQTRVQFAANAGQSHLPLAPWDNRKWREEYDMARAKLSDQNFNIGNYPDPLLPREPLKQPKGWEEAEQRLKALMAKIEGRPVGA